MMQQRVNIQHICKINDKHERQNNEQNTSIKHCEAIRIKLGDLTRVLSFVPLCGELCPGISYALQ